MYKTCPCCGKNFYIDPAGVNFGDYVYKVRKNQENYLYLCSYTCWRKETKDNKFRRSM